MVASPMGSIVTAHPVRHSKGPNMKTLANSINAPQAKGDAPDVVLHSGKVTFYFSGTYTSTTVVYRPEDGEDFVPLLSSMSAEAVTVDAPPGTYKAVVSGTVSNATVLAIIH